MARIWRSKAGILLLACFLLGVVAQGCIAIAHPAPRPAQQAAWLPFAAFLTWRVSRGGRVSRIILILVMIGFFVAAIRVGPSGWNLSVLGLLAIYAAQLGLLLSPAVYQRTRPGPLPGQAADRFAAQATPPLWMMLTALLVGVVVTLLFLGSMDYAALPGCGQAGATTAQLPNSCFGLQQGFPLRFLAAYQGIPQINKAALIKDWAQWSLVSFSVLYLLRLQIRHRELADSQPEVSEEPSTV